MRRTGQTPFDRPPLDPRALDSGRHYLFIVVSDSTLNFRPSDVSAGAGKKRSKGDKNLTGVCNFFCQSGNLDTHLPSGTNASAWDSAAPGWQNYRPQHWGFWECTES
eukprot:13864125-Alexandrium_andersonii.AAC.1